MSNTAQPATAHPQGDEPGPTPTDAIVLNQVSKTYGAGDLAVHAVRDATLRVARGEFVVLLGPSGSGKTTLLNLVGGIEGPTAGGIVIDGMDLIGLDGPGRTAFRRTHVGFVFQFYNLIPSLTARENVELVVELIGRKRQDRQVAEAALTAVGLGERQDHFPSALSGGEQQRVAIARALAKDPPVLLCDEPTGALDLETGRAVLGLLRGVATRGRTVLLVTHNAAIAAIADRVVRMRSGQIVEDVRVNQPAAPETVQW